jgi:hypothetical protein
MDALRNMCFAKAEDLALIYSLETNEFSIYRNPCTLIGKSRKARLLARSQSKL